MFGNSIAQEIIATIVVAVLGAGLGLAIRKWREYSRTEIRKLSIFKVLNLPDDLDNTRESYFFCTAIVSSKAISMKPLTFGSSGKTIPYQILPIAGKVGVGANPFDQEQSKSFTVACDEKTPWLGIAGSVAEAHLDPKDYWFGTQVLEDNTAASVVADFSSIRDFDSRVKNYNVSYWRNAEEKLDMCPATLDPLGNNVFVARINSEDGKKGYILKIEFDLVV